MNDLSAKVQRAIFGAVTGQTNATGVYVEKAPPTATMPYLVFNRQAAATEWAFNNTRVLENDLWQVRCYCDGEAAENLTGSESPQQVNNSILQAAEALLANGLPLPGGGSVSAVFRLYDAPSLQEDLGDRIIYSDGFILRVAAEP